MITGKTTERSWRQLSIVSSIAPWLLAGSPVAAQTPGEIDELREQLLASFDPARLGSGYGAMVSFAVSPDITTATFYPDHDPGVIDPTIKVLRAPYRHVFGPDNGKSRLFIQGLLAYQTLESAFEALPDEFVDSRWRTYGASLSLGYEIPLNDYLDLLPSLNASYGRIDNRAHYAGPISENVLQPVLEGIVFDWDADVVVYGASFAADYKRSFERFDLEVLGGLIYHRVDTVDSSTPFVDFTTVITAFDVEVNSVFPTSLKLGASTCRRRITWQYDLARTQPGCVGFRSVL